MNKQAVAAAKQILAETRVVAPSLGLIRETLLDYEHIEEIAGQRLPGETDDFGMSISCADIRIRDAVAAIEALRTFAERVVFEATAGNI